MFRAWGCNGERAAGTGGALVAEKGLEDASTPDGQVNSGGEENLSLRIKELEKSKEKVKGLLEDYMESDSILRNRMKELELSDESLQVTIAQLDVKLQQVENANVRVKGKLRDIQEELMSLVETQEKSEKKQKEKLQWLQKQLKVKEDEIKRQTEYFEHYKQRQRQQTAVLRGRECYLQSEISRLEKQVLDLNAHIALLTSELGEGMVQDLQEKLKSSFRGTQSYQQSGMEAMELQTCLENVELDLKSHLEMFQQNLKSFREKEEDTRREQAGLLAELQCSQDTEDFLRKKLEKSCHRVYNLQLSELRLQEKVEELLDENRSLKDQSRVRLKKKKAKDSQLARLENGSNSVDLNEDLIQDDLKRGAALGSLRSRATQTSLVLLPAQEPEPPGWSCEEQKQMEELPEAALLGLEHNSSSFAGVTGLAEVEEVTLGTKRTGIPEDNSSLFRCTPSYGAARPLPPCSEKLTNEKETKGEENFCLLREKALELPAKSFPLSVVEALMRKKLHLTLVEPANYHPSSVPTMGGVRSLDFCEGNPDLCSGGFCLGAEGGFVDKASPHLHRNSPCTLTGIFTSSLEKHNVEKHWEKKQIRAKSTSENKCLDKVMDNGKDPQKILIGRAKIEEVEDEKAQPQEVSCAAEGSCEVLFKTEWSHPGKQGIEARDNPGGSQDDRKLSVGFKILKKHFEGSPGLLEEQGNLSEICISHGNGVKNGEIIIKVEGEGEPHQKPTQQTNPSSTMSLKREKDQTLKLYEPKEKTLSCQKRAAKNMQCSHSQKFLYSKGERCPVNLLSPRQEGAVFLSKILPGSSFYECFCHLSALEAGKEWNGTIKALEKVVAVCSERIDLLMQENENYSEKICVLQRENERYTEVMCALEEEMDAYLQYILEVDEASFQNLVNEKEIAGGCYTNLAEEKPVKPGTCFVETFSKKLSCVEEKNRNSEKGSLTIASKKLPRSVSSLDGRKMRCLQLLSDLKEERSRCSTEIAKLLQDKENSVAKYHELIQEREENLQRIALLEGEKETLLGCLAEVTCEKDKYRTLIAELQECKTSCYQTISDLQEERDVLKREMDKIKRETSEQVDELQKANINFILENSKLKEFVTSLGFTYEELRKNKGLGTKEKTGKQKEESQQCALKPKKLEAVSRAAQTEEGALFINTSNYFPGKEGKTFESYSMMKEQLEKAKEELEKQQKELEKSKKEAQKWYTELGFAETRYEETQTRLTQVLTEFNHLKQEVGDKMPGKQPCKLMPVFPVQDGQEMQEIKIAKKRLQQQVLTLKAQLRDQAAFQNHFHDLQNAVELLQAQLAEKEEELQKRQCEEKLMVAPLKAKLACLTQKCQERNSFITRMQAEFHSHGIIHPALDEEVKKLVNDMTLAEYTAAFTSVCGREVVAPSPEISEASGQPGDQDRDVTGHGMTGFIPANSLQEVDGTCSSCITPNKLTSPERILPLHQELRQNHGKNYQIPPAVSSNSNPKADCKLPRIQEEAPWPLLSGMKDGLVPAEHRAFWVTKGRDWLSRCDDVFWGQVRNQPAGAIPQGMKQKNATMNKAWLSREKTDGSSSATTAESCLSDTLAASNKG